MNSSEVANIAASDRGRDEIGTVRGKEGRVEKCKRFTTDLPIFTGSLSLTLVGSGFRPNYLNSKEIFSYSG